MAGIAEDQLTTIQIDKSDKHRDEHTLFIIFGEGVVHSRCYFGRHHVLSGESTE